MVINTMIEEEIRRLRNILEERRTKYTEEQVSWEMLPPVFELPEMWAFTRQEEAREQLASIFKSYDIRGVVISYDGAGDSGKISANLGPGIAERVGRSLGCVVFDSLPGPVKGLNPGDCFVLGMDNGRTSPDLLEGLVRGLIRSGINVVILGEGCTGEVYGMIQKLNAQGGIMITRSHVEKEYNGMKIVLGREALHSEYINRIRDSVFEGRARRADKDASVLKIGDETSELYMDCLEEEFRSGIEQGHAPVAVNFGGGTARLYARAFERILGDRLVKTFRIESDPEASGGLPDPTQPRYLQEQIRWSIANPQVTLFSFDLDADRVSVMVAGELFLGDMIGFPLAAHKIQVDRPDLISRLKRLGTRFDETKLEELAGTVLADPRCSKQLTQLVRGLGGRPVQHRIGHSHIKSTMNRLMDALALSSGFSSPRDLVEQTDYVMWQAEYSLHFFGTDEYGVPSDDALRFMLKFITIMDQYAEIWNVPGLTIRNFLQRKKAEGLFDDFLQAPEIRTVYDNSDKARVVAGVEEAFREVAARNNWEIAGMDVLEDGFRLDTPDGFILFRYSNTSPKLTMRIEARDKEEWIQYFELLFRHYNRLRKPEYGLDMNENAFLRDDFGIRDPDRIR